MRRNANHMCWRDGSRYDVVQRNIAKCTDSLVTRGDEIRGEDRRSTRWLLQYLAVPLSADIACCAVTILPSPSAVDRLVLAAAATLQCTAEHNWIYEKKRGNKRREEKNEFYKNEWLKEQKYARIVKKESSIADIRLVHGWKGRWCLEGVGGQGVVWREGRKWEDIHW